MLQDRQALQRLKEAAEKAKIELSTTMQTEINLPYLTADASGPKHLVMTMSRAKLEQLTADLVDKTIAPVKQALSDAGLTAGDINAAERAVERQMLILLAELKKGLAILATVGATSPFVGLLGTTMGIVNAFTGMAVTGSGGLAAISAGIAEALITTAFGLLTAIPAVWFYNYFQTQIESITVEMTYTSKEMIDFLIKSVGSEFGRSIFTKEFQTQKAAGSKPISQ